MSKNKKQKSVEVENPMANFEGNFNPFQFGYAPDSMVTIPGALFTKFMNLSAAVAQKETQEMVEIIAFEMGAQNPQPPEKETVRVFTTPMGKEAEQTFNETMTIHLQNIETGVATNIEESNRPKLDLGDELNA